MPIITVEPAWAGVVLYVMACIGLLCVVCTATIVVLAWRESIEERRKP